MVERLRKENLQVTVRPSDQLFNSLAELQPFDTVILADVPREDFSDAQIKMLVRNTQQMGSGLVMLGGPNSFGAGGWTGTEVEEAMPVDFQIKNKQVVPIGALAMLMHASEMADGNHWQKKIADAALEALGTQDYCGVIHWDGNRSMALDRRRQRHREDWRSEDNRNKMKARIDRMVPGDMPGFEARMTTMLNDFNNLPPEVAVKHTIVISDGDPGGPSVTRAQGFKKAKIKISTVASASSAGTARPNARKCRRSPRPPAASIIEPKIAERAAADLSERSPRRFAAAGFRTQDGLPAAGDVSARNAQGHRRHAAADHRLCADEQERESAGRSRSGCAGGPAAATEANRTILAGWTYGLGKTVALTTDAGKRWATDWTDWADYDKLFSQIVRWSMRPAGDQGKFTVTTDLEDGKVRVTITALDKDDEFLNFLNMGGSVVGPDMKPIDLKIRQTAPGRYVGEFDSPESGSYFMMLSPGAGMAPILSGVNVPYSAEYLDRETNEGLLKSLAGVETQRLERAGASD